MSAPHRHAAVIRAWADGATIEQRDPNLVLSSMPPQPDPWRPFAGKWSDAMEYRVKPEKVYPETRMTRDDLISAAGPGSWLDPAVVRSIANAAIRHAIDSGQVVRVVPPGDAGPGYLMCHDGQTWSWKLPAQVRDERDMAIARAVRDAIVGTAGDDASFINVGHMKRFALFLNLDAIIAGVKL